MRARATTLTIAGLIGLGAAAVPATAAEAMAAPACTPGRLAVSLGGSDGTAGSVVQTVVLRNVSGRTCRLGGYPGMAFYAASGAVLRSTVSRATTPFGNVRPRTLVVRPGARASYGLLYVEPQTGPCPTTAEVAVTPPNATRSLLVAARIPVCAGQPMTVSPIVPGAAGPS